LLVSLSALLAMPYHVLVPIFAKEVFGGGAGRYGVLMTAAGVGAVLGSLCAASAPVVRRKGAVLHAASFAFPFLLGAFAFARSYPLALALLVAAGFSFVLQSAPANSLLQTLVPDALRGRVMAIYVSLFLGMMRLGALLLGLVAARFSAPAALAAAGGASLLATVFVALRYPELRRTP